MKGLFLALGSLGLAMIASAQDLPTREGESDDDEAGEVEPALLIQGRKPDGSLVLSGAAASAPDLDLEKLEKNLARAQRSAASAESLYRAGIISKMEAEERGLRAVRLEAVLAQARLEFLQRQPQPNETTLAQAEQAAARAREQKDRAELEAAVRNLQRQQKLLALGSGRKADVSRAQQKLAELQHPRE